MTTPGQNSGLKTKLPNLYQHQLYDLLSIISNLELTDYAMFSASL